MAADRVGVMLRGAHEGGTAFLARDHVEHARIGEFAMNRRPRATHDFDRFDLLDRHVEHRIGIGRQCRVHGAAVQQDLHVAGGKASADPSHQGLAAADLVGGRLDAGHQPQCVPDRSRPQGGHLVAVQHRDQTRHVVGIEPGLGGDLGLFLENLEQVAQRFAVFGRRVCSLRRSRAPQPKRGDQQPAGSSDIHHIPPRVHATRPPMLVVFIGT